MQEPMRKSDISNVEDLIDALVTAHIIHVCEDCGAITSAVFPSSHTCKE